MTTFLENEDGQFVSPKYAIVGNPHDPGEMCVIGTFETKTNADDTAKALSERYPEAGVSVVPYFDPGVALL